MITAKPTRRKPRKDSCGKDFRIYVTARLLDSGKYRPCYEICRVTPSETLSSQTIMEEHETFLQAQESAFKVIKTIIDDLTNYRIVYAQHPNVKKSGQRKSTLIPLPDKSLRSTFDYGVFHILSSMGMIGGKRV